MLASASSDRRVMCWDLARCGLEQTEEEKKDGPPELVFIHGGHTARVSDISWNLNERQMMASVAEDNVL
jgi:histone-binding protein RBBP4